MAQITTVLRRLERTRRLLSRQNDSGWTDQYLAGIRATRAEAPSRSRPSMLSSVNRTNRELHLLSLPERAAALVALAHPALVDLHEQKVLQPLQSLHPLAGHIEMRGEILPPMLGTYQAYAQLGAAARHPMIITRSDSGERMFVPDVLVGDLLLFLRDVLGLYCVNWSVKADEKDFGSAPLRSGGGFIAPEDFDKVSLRCAAEEICCGSAGIPTHWISEATFDRQYILNLEALFCWQSERARLSDFETDLLVPFLQAAIHERLTLLDACRYFMQKWRRPRDDFRVAIGILIWDRKVRVDLFTRIFLDGPLHPETQDPLIRYARLFARGAG